MWAWIERLFGARQDENAASAPLVVHESFDGAIRCYRAPSGPDWHCNEARREGDGFLVSTLSYLRPAQPAPLVLTCKIYELTDGAAPPPPRQTDWEATFAALFRHIDHVRVEEAEQLQMQGTLPACEATLVGDSPAGWPLTVRERRAVQGSRMLIIGALGPREMMTAQAATVDAWFAETAFDLAS